MTPQSQHGVRPDNAPAAEFDEAYWDRLMSVDLKGTALCMKHELAQMVAQGSGGSIVNISSVSGFRPQPNTIAYVAAKHGVNGLTKNAAMEYGRHNIRVPKGSAIAEMLSDYAVLREQARVC